MTILLWCCRGIFPANLHIGERNFQILEERRKWRWVWICGWFPFVRLLQWGSFFSITTEIAVLYRDLDHPLLLRCSRAKTVVLANAQDRQQVFLLVILVIRTVDLQSSRQPTSLRQTLRALVPSLTKVLLHEPPQQVVVSDKTNSFSPFFLNFTIKFQIQIPIRKWI